MRTRQKNRVPTTFVEEESFAVAAQEQANTRRAAEFARLQERLLESAFTHTETLSLFGAIRQAANEAAGLAFTTEYPLLVFPALFDEKASEFRKHEQRQQKIMARTQALVEQVSA